MKLSFFKILQNFRNIPLHFWCIVLLVGMAMVVVAFHCGTGGDDILDGSNGRYALKYYCEGDTTFADYSKVPEMRTPHLKYYGTGFEIIPAIVNRVFQVQEHEFLIRRILIAVFGFLLMLFSALIAKDLKGWKLASVTLLSIALMPTVFGLSFYGSKDIPMAAAFAIGVYGFLRIYRTFPLLRPGDCCWAFIGMALAVSIRIGGLLLPFYFALGFVICLLCRKEWRSMLRQGKAAKLVKAVLICGGIAISASLAGLCAYPNFFYEGPVDHIRHAFEMVSKFKQNIPFMFEGKLVSSLHLPDYYLLKSYLITIPVFILAGILFFVFRCRKIWREYDRTGVLLLLFALVFPGFYISFTDANVYTGWRHTLFIASSVAVVASIGMYEMYLFFNTPLKRRLYAIVMVIVALPTAWWMVSNYKYTYSYYNVFVKEPYLNYELDYFETSCVKAYDWLRDNVLKKKDEKVTVSTKIFTPVRYSRTLGDTNVNIKVIPFMAFAETDCDYSIINYQIISSKILKKFFPPKGTVHTECVDGKPVCAVVKRENKFDSQGIKAVREKKIDEGVELLEKAYQYNPDNFGIWFWLGYGYYYQRKYKECVTFLQKYLNFWPSSGQAVIAMTFAGHALVELKMFDQAIQVLKQVENMPEAKGNQSFIQAQLGIAYYNKQAYKEAVVYLKKALNAYPLLNDMLHDCYTRLEAKTNKNL